MDPHDLDRDPALRDIVSDLAREFSGTFGRQTIERYVVDTWAQFHDARIRTYVPALAERFARERLRALAQVEGLLPKSKPEVLFVCVHNAGRSQMAAALTDALSDGQVHVRSAGSDPAERINPAVLTVMAETGLDLSKEFPKPLTDEVVGAADVVITMGCGDACPIYPGKRYLDWDVDDPAGQPVEKVRAIRDDVRCRVEGLLRELGIATAYR
jgi:arsenate reductase (thioredoxin)